MKMKNKYLKRYIKLELYLAFNFWKISEKRYFRLCKKLDKLKYLQRKERLKNLGVKEK